MGLRRTQGRGRRRPWKYPGPRWMLHLAARRPSSMPTHEGRAACWNDHASALWLRRALMVAPASAGALRTGEQQGPDPRQSRWRPTADQRCEAVWQCGRAWTCELVSAIHTRRHALVARENPKGGCPALFARVPHLLGCACGDLPARHPQRPRRWPQPRVSRHGCGWLPLAEAWEPVTQL